MFRTSPLVVRPQDIAVHAQTHQQVIITRDFDFADIRNYPPDQYSGMVVLDLPSHAIVPDK